MATNIEALRKQLGTTFQSLVSNAKTKYQSSYYIPESSNSPLQATKLASEIAFDVLTSVDAQTADQFLAEIIKQLEERRAALSKNDFADPDGYGCAALREMIAEVHAIAATLGES